MIFTKGFSGNLVENLKQLDFGIFGTIAVRGEEKDAETKFYDIKLSKNCTVTGNPEKGDLVGCEAMINTYFSKKQERKIIEIVVHKMELRHKKGSSSNGQKNYNKPKQEAPKQNNDASNWLDGML